MWWVDCPELDGFGSASAFVIMPPHRVRVIVAALQDELVNVFVQSEPIRTKAVTHSLVRPPSHACPGAIRQPVVAQVLFAPDYNFSLRRSAAESVFIQPGDGVL